MKKTAFIVAAIAAVGIAVFAFSGSSAGRAGVARNDPAPSSNAPPSKTERIDDSHDPDRFDSLDDETKNLALELEKAAIKWQRSRPEHESFHRLWNDWRKYSIERISSLSTEQIRALAGWLDSGFSSELEDYRQAIIMVWSSREPEVARAHLLTNAEWARSIEKDLISGENMVMEEISDDFHQARIGHAMKDPRAAWKELLQDAADPGMKGFVNVNVTLPDLFREYAAKLPEEAWDLALTANDGTYCERMIEGFADGAPAGQDWEKRGLELAQSLADRNLKVSYQAFQSIGERWVMEDPAAALDWYAHSAPKEALDRAYDRLTRDDPADPFADPFAEASADDPFERRPPSDPAEVADLLKTDLLTGMYGSHKDRTREVMAALDQLVMRGEERLATAVIGQLVGTHLAPRDIPLLEQIARIPSEENRMALFVQAVQAIPIRDNDPFASSFDTLESPNASLAAVRELSTRLGLPEEIRAEAEKEFRRIEAEELKALEALEQKRRDGDDPFFSR